MTNPRPNFTIARICRNCMYGKFETYDYYGDCLLPKTTDPDAEPLKTHTQCTCDAHVWVKSKTKIHKPAMEVGATVPDDVL